MYTGAIFDLDGTLLDSMDVWRDIDIEFLGKRGIEVPEDYLKNIAALGFDGAADYTINRFGFKESKEAIIKEWFDMAYVSYSEKVLLKAGVKEYLKALKNNGIKIVAATASDRLLFEAALKNNGIYDYFDDFVTVSEVSRGKGFPDIYELAAKKINTDVSKCVVFEDILKGVTGAKDGDFVAVAMYDKHSEYDEEEIKKYADKYIHDFNEIIDFVHEGAFDING